MPSRKRNKAKERKAKKAEARISSRVQSWQEWSLWGIEHPKIQCNHGCNSNIPSIYHPVYKFIETYIKGVMNDISFSENLQTLLTTMPEVWKEETLRNETVCILTSMATNQMLNEYYYGSNSLSQATWISKTIIALESHNLITDDDIVTIFYHPPISSKFMNLSTNPKASGKRDVLKFLSRRISCSCLKDMYRQARQTIPKSLHCSYCSEVKERDQLLLCGGCRSRDYCSTECQAADWKRDHKQNCLELAGHQRAYANRKR